MRISDWSSDVCSSDLRSSSETSEASSCRSKTYPSFLATLLSACLSSTALSIAPIRYCRKTVSLPSFSRHMRSEEHTSELQSLMRISYAVFCLKKKPNTILTAETTDARHHQS